MMSNDELIDYLCSEGILYDEDVEKAMRKVDRLAFIDPKYLGQAYEDRPLPTSCGQTISAPHMVALMTQHLSVMPGMKILDIGAGSGYQAAILSQLVGPEGEVHTVEKVVELAQTAKNRLIPYTNLRVHIANGSWGLKKHAPFDRILVAAAAHSVPQALLDQLVEGGRMVIPLGHGAAQRLTLIEKFAGQIKKTDLDCTCIFVPLAI